MNIPKNHHYVSQCLIRNFFEKGKIFLYDKSRDNVFDRNSSKRVFSEEGLNTVVNDEGELDFSTIENELNQYFEKEFPNRFNTINEIVNDEHKLNNPQKVLELENSLSYVLNMAIIGDMRTPNRKSNMDDAILGTLLDVLKDSNSLQKQQLDELVNDRTNLKYKLSIDFIDISKKIVERMRPFIWDIYLAPEKSFFLLPDCTSMTRRSKLIEDTVIDGITHSNLAREISAVDMPISSKIFIRVQSMKATTDTKNRICVISPKSVFNLNSGLYASANKYVACQDEYYLKKFIKEYKQTYEV